MALVPNVTKQGALRCAIRSAQILRSVGIEPVGDVARQTTYAALGEKMQCMPIDALYNECDAVIVFGGDGTVLGAARRAADADIPVLGINFGHVGYIAELEEAEIQMLTRLSTGEFFIEERMLLDVSIGKNGNRLFYAKALNEAAITRGIISRLADFTLCCDGTLVGRYRADGMIVATPTGSTAYSMAAGGPVIDPKLEAISVTPICSYSPPAARTLVFGPQSVIKIIVPSARHAEAIATVDGRAYFKINDGELAVTLSRSDKKIKLIKLKKCSFGNTLYQKFGVG